MLLDGVQCLMGSQQTGAQALLCPPSMSNMVSGMFQDQQCTSSMCPHWLQATALCVVQSAESPSKRCLRSRFPLGTLSNALVLLQDAFMRLS